MAKQRKTREQKIAASQKHQHNTIQYSLNYIKQKTEEKQKMTHVSPVMPYAYVASDLKKTMNVCFSFILVEIALFLLLQHQLVRIPGVVY